MATNKSYSDLEQSKTLSKILPLESADMYYEPSTGYCTELSEVRFGDIKYAHPRSIRCWSLAALFGVLPNYEINNFGDGIQLAVNKEAFVTEGDETLLDLVVNMIIHLHELKML